MGRCWDNRAYGQWIFLFFYPGLLIIEHQWNVFENMSSSSSCGRNNSVQGVSVCQFSSRIQKTHQTNSSFSTVFECGLLQWRHTQNQTCDLPVSPNTNPACRPDCVVCLSLCVTSSITYTPPPCSLSSTSVYTLQCQHRRSAMATHTAMRRSEQGPLLAPGALQLLLEKRFGKYFEVASNGERGLRLWCGESASVLCYCRC